MTTRTKSAALLQRCRMASKSAAKELRSGSLQQCQILAAKRCHGQRFASDKKRFSSDTKTPKKDNQRCWIAAIRFKNAKYVYEVFISEAIGSGLAAFDSKLIVPGPCSHARNHNCKKMQIFLIIYSFSLPVFIECPSSLFYLVVCPNGEYCEKPVHELSLQWFI